MSDKSIKYKVSHSVIDGVNTELNLFKYDGAKVILSVARFNRSTGECVSDKEQDAKEIEDIVVKYDLKDYFTNTGVIQIYTDDTIFASVGGFANEFVASEEFKIPGTDIIIEKGDKFKIIPKKESVGRMTWRNLEDNKGSTWSVNIWSNKSITQSMIGDSFIDSGRSGKWYVKNAVLYLDSEVNNFKIGLPLCEISYYESSDSYMVEGMNKEYRIQISLFK